MALDPGEPDAHIQYGRFLFYTGRVAAARTEFERARELDPYSAVASGWVGHMLMLYGRTSEGLSELKRALEIDSTNPPVLTFASDAFRSMRMHNEAKELAERLWRTVPPWRPVAAVLLAELGDRDRALTFVRELETQQPLQPAANTLLATLYSALGDTAQALGAFERATDAAEIWPTFYSTSEPRFDPLRRSARFAAVIRRVGLDERIFTSPTGGRPSSGPSR